MGAAKNKLNEEFTNEENKKNGEILDLKKRIDQMSGEFANMLQGTLENMRKKIEQANTAWENENDLDTLKKFDK